MKQAIYKFLNNEINLQTFIEGLDSYTLTSEKIIHQVIEDYNDIDKGALVYLILYYIYKMRFQEENDFISFLNSIHDITNNDFSKEIKYIHLNDNVAIFRIDHIFFIINNNDDSITVDVPEDLQNDYQFCINCNHELYFGKTLSLEAFEFYLISDEK